MWHVTICLVIKNSNDSAVSCAPLLLRSSRSQPAGLALLRLPNWWCLWLTVSMPDCRAGAQMVFLSVTCFLPMAGHCTRQTPTLSPETPPFCLPIFDSRVFALKHSWIHPFPEHPSARDFLSSRHHIVAIRCTVVPQSLLWPHVRRSLDNCHPQTSWLHLHSCLLSLANLPLCSVTQSKDRFFMCADLDRPMFLVMWA